MRNAVEILYEYLTVDVPFSDTRTTANTAGGPPYYLQSSLPEQEGPCISPLEEAIAQYAAQGWEFCAVEGFTFKPRAGTPGYLLGVTDTARGYYRLSFRRAK